MRGKMRKEMRGGCRSGMIGDRTRGRISGRTRGSIGRGRRIGGGRAPRSRLTSSREGECMSLRRGSVTKKETISEETKSTHGPTRTNIKTFKKLGTISVGMRGLIRGVRSTSL